MNVNPESRVKVKVGPAAKKLIEQGWRTFLVKVHNEAGVTAPLRCSSPNALTLHDTTNSPESPQKITPQDVVQRWLDVSLDHEPPLAEPLSGLPLEYCVIELFSRDRGQREAKLAFDVGQGTQDLGFRNEVNILFDCEPCARVKFKVRDEDGQPTMGQFTIRDARGRVYPARARRLAPDFFFHDQIYRRDGEEVLLPAGKYHVRYSRGPEYRVLERDLDVTSTGPQEEVFQLERWINLAKAGWYSDDHHVHAAGCSHYSSPTQGVAPADMMRHIIGEDLNVGCVLTWGPCWYYQKQFFDGKVSALSTSANVMRYDVEVSGFPSSHAGHLVLLRLKEDDYPGTKRIEDWPSWDLPVLKWAKEQGGVVGFAHSGWGLAVPAKALPTYDMPPFDGIGANEYIVDVTHDAVDFISAVDTPCVWELNIWYHTLNCGFTTRISGETDFPCIYGERVGLGRVYVKLGEQRPVEFGSWVEGVRDGRSYCCDGHTHLFDFTVNGLGVGEAGAEGRKSVLAVKGGEKLKARCKAAALLASEPPPDEISTRELDKQPYWHVERARVKGTRQVPVELIVNGQAVERRMIEADGRTSEVEFEYAPARSSWVALRVFPAAHTNPVFVEVDGAPIRASKRSAQWCLDAVDQCWKAKQAKIRDTERPAAEEAYEQARGAYRKILAESFDDVKP
ncbi:MAG: CehA/McbA family metallohydrolase [Pirellulales bacterium]